MKYLVFITISLIVIGNNNDLIHDNNMVQGTAGCPKNTIAGCPIVVPKYKGFHKSIKEKYL